jgi:hypothetical protein
MGLDIRHVKPCFKEEAEVLDYFVSEEISANNQFFQKYLHLLTKAENEDFFVIYFKEVGYQRKGMNKKFISEFENEKLYFSKDDVIKAYHFIEPNSNYSLQELQDYFKDHFIENFIEGESVFFISW